jgi:acyl-CoA thioester hydrolase
MDQNPASTPASTRKPPGTRADYRFFAPVGTRWNDNDMLGHVNNVVYLSFCDTVLTAFELKHAGIDLIHGGDISVVMAEVSCRFHSSVSFPDNLTIGLRVAHVGKTSYIYEMAVFREDDDIAAAEGRFIRVLVAMPGQHPVPIPDSLRNLLGTFAAG